MRRKPSSIVPPPPPHDGDRLLIPCEGGPSISRLVHHPPPHEIEEGHHGIYVLDERTTDPEHPDWVYVYIDERM